MSTPRVAFIAVSLVAAAFLFSFVYQNFSGMNDGDRGTSTMTTTQSQMKTEKKEVTPDTATDDLIDEALADRDDLSAEESAEMAELEGESQTVIELNTVYEETENQ